MYDRTDPDFATLELERTSIDLRSPPGAALWWTVAFPASLVLATHIAAHVWGGVVFDAQRFWLPGALGLWGAALAAREVRLQIRLSRLRAERDRLRAALVGGGSAPRNDLPDSPADGSTVAPPPSVTYAADTDPTASICDRVLAGLEHDAPPTGRPATSRAQVAPRGAAPARHAPAAALGPGAER